MHGAAKKELSQQANPFAQIVQKKQQELQSQQMPMPQQTASTLFPQLPIQNFMQQQQTNQIQTSGSFLFTNQAPIAAARSVNPFSQLATNANANNQANPPIMAPQAFQAPIKLDHNLKSIASTTSSTRHYSGSNELTEQDLNEFKTGEFTLGVIPHCPPTRELCF